MQVKNVHKVLFHYNYRHRNISIEIEGEKTKIPQNINRGHCYVLGFILYSFFLLF